MAGVPVQAEQEKACHRAADKTGQHNRAPPYAIRHEARRQYDRNFQRRSP
jgi:hypothetical protein